MVPTRRARLSALGLTLMPDAWKSLLHSWSSFCTLPKSIIFGLRTERHETLDELLPVPEGNEGKGDRVKRETEKGDLNALWGSSLYGASSCSLQNGPLSVVDKEILLKFIRLRSKMVPSTELLVGYFLNAKYTRQSFDNDDGESSKAFVCPSWTFLHGIFMGRSPHQRLPAIISNVTEWKRHATSRTRDH